MTCRLLREWKEEEGSTDLLENQDLVGGFQVLQLMGDQDPGLVLQNTTDTPGETHMQTDKYVSV